MGFQGVRDGGEANPWLQDKKEERMPVAQDDRHGEAVKRERKGSGYRISRGSPK